MNKFLNIVFVIGMHLAALFVLLPSKYIVMHAQTNNCATRVCLKEINDELAFGMDTTNMRVWFSKNQYVSYEAKKLILWKGELADTSPIFFVRKNDSVYVSTLSLKPYPLKIYQRDVAGSGLLYMWEWRDDRYIYYLDWFNINDCCAQVQFSRIRVKREGKAIARWKRIGDYVILRPESE
jgi:hypothetical protein